MVPVSAFVELNTPLFYSLPQSGICINRTDDTQLSNSQPVKPIIAVNDPTQAVYSHYSVAVTVTGKCTDEIRRINDFRGFFNKFYDSL